MPKSEGGDAGRETGQNESSGAETRTVILDVRAAYNRDNLPLPGPNGPHGRRVLNLEMLMNHAFYWDWLNDREAAEVLMEIYVARTRRMQ